MDNLALRPGDPGWPERLSRRLGAEAPAALYATGNVAVLQSPLSALFCSARCPGDAIVRAYDQAAHWRDTGRAVVGGFHSPLEHECLRILLRGRQPVIVCPARGLPKRLAPELRAPWESGRLLILTAFPGAMRRVTTELAAGRNDLVAALADEVWFAHVTAGGEMARLAARIAGWDPGRPAPLPSLGRG